MALGVLNTTYNIAKAQLDAAKKSSQISGYFSGYYNYFKSSSPTRTTTPTSPPSPDLSTPNGVLRAHVVKAECCLLIAVLQLLQESVMSYVKCGMNLRRGKQPKNKYRLLLSTLLYFSLVFLFYFYEKHSALYDTLVMMGKLTNLLN